MTPTPFALEILLIGGLMTTDRNYVSMWVRRVRHDQEIARHSRSRSIGRLRCSLGRPLHLPRSTPSFPLLGLEGLLFPASATRPLPLFGDAEAVVGRCTAQRGTVPAAMVPL